MLNIALLWHDSPRWIRGWFIGSLAYICLALLTQLINVLYPNVQDSWGVALFFLIFPGFFGSPNPIQVVAHAFWCVLGALCVGRWGEKTGVGNLFLVVIILKLGIICWIIYALSHMTIF